ncbi:MAG: cysteine--tRNA ligase [Bacteroidota bacterium]
MALSVYNTLHRAKEVFHPLREGFVGMYVCGPTVYGHSHLGHAKSYVSFDVMVRYLRHLGYRVLYVQNVTDVGHLLGDPEEGEDRLLRQGRMERKHPMEIAEEYTRSYFQDMDALNVLRPDISPRATGHIPEQIALIRRLLAQGLAYEAGGSVYFNVERFPGYGRLSGRSPDEMMAGGRVEVRGEKRSPRDFALWKKASPEHILRWESPWGWGFPGWHLECSAMSMQYLGESFDIHGGGLENQFPHHECEIAQSEGATGKPFVKYWLHNNMVTVDGRKMGKSLGNFVTLKDAFARWGPAVVRFFIIQSHYRGTLDFSEQALEGAAKGLERLANAVRLVRDARGRAPGPGRLDWGEYRRRFAAAMDDDFNTPQALAVLFDLGRDLHQKSASGGVDEESLRQAEGLCTELGEGVLGIRFGEESAGSRTEDLLDLLVAVRREVRAQKLWPLSDMIRDGLGRLGYSLEDGKEGTTWKRIS